MMHADTEFWGGVVIAFLSALAVAYYVVSALLGRAARRWPTCQGKIIAVRTSTFSAQFLDPDYRVRLTYTFDFHGSSYTSRRIAFGASPFHAYRRATFERFCREYAEGALVRVHHHPRRPRLSVLEPGLRPMLMPGTLIFIAASVEMLIVGIAKMVTQ